jgi:hypothetical protein
VWLDIRKEVCKVSGQERKQDLFDTMTRKGYVKVHVSMVILSVFGCAGKIVISLHDIHVL